MSTRSLESTESVRLQRPTMRKDSTVKLENMKSYVHQATLFFNDTQQSQFGNGVQIQEQDFRKQLFSFRGPAMFRDLLFATIGLLICGLLTDLSELSDFNSNYGIRLGFKGAGIVLLLTMHIVCALNNNILQRTSQQTLSMLFAVSGCLWATGSVLRNNELKLQTQSIPVVTFLLIGHVVDKIYLFPFIFIASWVVSIYFLIVALIFQWTEEKRFLCIIQVLFVFLCNTLLSIVNYKFEIYRRRAFVNEQEMKNKNKELDMEKLDLRNEIFTMVLEKLELTDKEADLKSPVEKAMQILMQIAKTEKDSGSMTHVLFKKIKEVIDLLSSSDIFKPKMEQVIKAKDGKMDDTVKQWLSTLLDDDDDKKQDAKYEKKMNGQPERFSHILFQEFDRDLDDWNFNVFELADKMNNRPLLFVGIRLFKRYNLISKFNIDVKKLQNFLEVIEKGYQDQPYHNKLHAADVTRTVHYFITKGELYKYMSELEIMAALVASAIHDYDHPGVANNYLVRLRDEKAILYNDKSVLENHHCASAFKQLLKEENDIFKGLSSKQYEEVRKIIIEMVLATDLFHHFDHVSRFRNMMNGGIMKKEEDNSVRLNILIMALKCGDVGHAAKATKLHKSWSDMVVDEFYKQGDQEKKNNMQVSPFMDRTKGNVPKAQVGFIEFLVQPMYDVWLKFLAPVSLPCLTELENNKQYWLEREKKEVIKRQTDTPSPVTAQSNTNTPPPTTNPPSSSDSSHQNTHTNADKDPTPTPSTPQTVTVTVN